MAGETTHDSTHAVQLIECSITESLLDVDESSEEIKTCETPKDETIEQENQSEIDIININNTDNTVCSLALKEPEEVAILEELQNEVGNFRNDPDKTDKRQDTTETMRTQGEDATSTKDKDAEEDNARQEEEVDGFLKNGKVIVAQKAKKNNAMVNQKRNNDSNSSKEDGTIGFPKDEAVDITADDGIKVFEVDTKEQRDFFDQMEALEPCGNVSLHEVAEEHDGKDGVTVEDNARQEEEVDDSSEKEKVIVAQKAKKNHDKVNQKKNNGSKSFNEGGTIGIPINVGVDVKADDGIKVFEVDTMDRMDSFDQIETVESCGSPSLNKTAEEHDGRDGATVEVNARQEDIAESSLKNGKVIVAQKAKKNNDMVNQKRNNDSNSFDEEGTVGIPKDVGVDITADDKIQIFEVDTKERRDSFDQIETVETCGSASLHKTAEEHDGKDGATVEDNARQEEGVDDSSEKEKIIVAQKAKKNNDMVNKKKNNDSNSFDEEGTVGIPKDEAVDITAVDEIMIFCSQKKETIIAQKMEESNYGINQKQSFSADGKIGIPMDVAVNNTADDGIKVFEEDTKEQRDSFDQIEAMEPCESPSLHKTAEEHDGKDGATVEELDDSSQKEKEVFFVQNVEESNNSEVINKWNEKSVGLIGDGSIVIAKDDDDIDIDSAADDDTNVFEVDTKKGRDSFDQIEESLVEPCGNPSLHDANGTFAISDQDQEAQDVYFSMVITNGDPSSPHAKDAIAENIQQGELLLYRLHLVQQNQELQQVSDGPSASNTAAMATTNITVNSVTLRPGTEGEDDDLPCEVDIIHKNEDQEEVVGTTSAGIGEDNQVVMGKENIWRPLEETPIQREIRHGLEREKSLRRSRGLGDLENKSEELVEIPVMRSPEVFGDQSSGTNVGLNVERRLAKRKMLQDINQEAMKEQGVKKLGKIPGLYEEGYAQELKERRMLFESFHQSKKTDVQVSSKGRKLFSSSFTAKNAETPLVQSLERTRSLDFFTNHHLKDSTCPSAGRESHKNDTDSHKECQIKYLEDDATSASSNETHSVQKSLRPSISSSSLDCSSWTMLSVQDNRKEDEEGSVLKGKNPFFKLRPSLSLRPDVEKEIKEAMEREQELRRLRSRLYGDQWNRSGDQQEEGSTKSSCPEAASTVSSDHVYRGKLTLIWPPPHSKVDEDPGPPKPIGQRSTLQHHWESGMQ